MMQQISDGIWTVPSPLTYYGLLVNTRMTVCRLSDGGLALVAPVRSSEALTATIDALGPVRAIIAPNLMHHLYVGDWMEAYPDALSYGPPGLAAKRPELTFTHDVDPKTAGDVASYSMKAWTYVLRAQYGSPEVDHATPKITGVTVGKDNKSVRLKVEGLVKGHVHHLVSSGVRSKDDLPLLHPNAYYTLNEIPGK